MAFIVASSGDIILAVAGKARSLRLAGGLTQEELAARAGVSLASLRRFERTGEASFRFVAKIAMALRTESGFETLFQMPIAANLDEALRRTERPRQRGRRRSGHGND